MVQYDFKIDGEVLTGDNLNNNYSFNTLGILDLILDGADSTSQENLIFVNSSSTNANRLDDVNSTGVWGGVQIGENVAFCTIYDQFTDASVDITNRWTVTGGGSSESNFRLTLSGSSTHSIISDGGSGGGNPLDMRSFSGNSEVIFPYRLSSTGGTCGLQISNGSTHVNLKSISTGTVQGLMRLIFNKSAETVDVYFDGQSVSLNDLDISSVTTNWYIRLNVTGGGSTGTVQLYGIGYANGDSGTIDNIYQITAGSSSTAGINKLVFNDPGSVGDPTTLLSTDGGSSYGTVDTFKRWEKSGSAGTGIKFKVTANLPTSLSTTLKNILTISAFISKYG